MRSFNICEKTISNHNDANKDHKCDYCGKVISNHKDADKNHICDLCGKTISNHKDENKDHKCDYCGKVISNHKDTDKNHICDICKKTISNHTGGKATCIEKAVCEVCGERYGDIDPDSHSALRHIDTAAATEEAEGNREYWYCDGCERYFGDKDGKKEITKAETVLEKLPKTPEPTPKPEVEPIAETAKTGDTANPTLWVALLFISGGVLTGTVLLKKRRKHSAK